MKIMLCNVMLCYVVPYFVYITITIQHFKKMRHSLQWQGHYTLYSSKCMFYLVDKYPLLYMCYMYQHVFVFMFVCC